MMVTRMLRHIGVGLILATMACKTSSLLGYALALPVEALEVAPAMTVEEAEALISANESKASRIVATERGRYRVIRGKPQAAGVNRFNVPVQVVPLPRYVGR